MSNRGSIRVHRKSPTPFSATRTAHPSQISERLLCSCSWLWGAPCFLLSLATAAREPLSQLPAPTCSQLCPDPCPGSCTCHLQSLPAPPATAEVNKSGDSKTARDLWFGLPKPGCARGRDAFGQGFSFLLGIRSHWAFAGFRVRLYRSGGADPESRSIPSRGASRTPRRVPGQPHTPNTERQGPKGPAAAPAAAAPLHPSCRCRRRIPGPGSTGAPLTRAAGSSAAPLAPGLPVPPLLPAGLPGALPPRQARRCRAALPGAGGGRCRRCRGLPWLPPRRGRAPRPPPGRAPRRGRCGAWRAVPSRAEPCRAALSQRSCRAEPCPERRR